MLHLCIIRIGRRRGLLGVEVGVEVLFDGELRAGLVVGQDEVDPVFSAPDGPDAVQARVARHEHKATPARRYPHELPKNAAHQADLQEPVEPALQPRVAPLEAQAKVGIEFRLAAGHFVEVEDGRDGVAVVVPPVLAAGWRDIDIRPHPSIHQRSQRPPARLIDHLIDVVIEPPDLG